MNLIYRSPETFPKSHNFIFSQSETITTVSQVVFLQKWVAKSLAQVPRIIFDISLLHYLSQIDTTVVVSFFIILQKLSD